MSDGFNVGLGPKSDDSDTPDITGPSKLKRGVQAVGKARKGGLIGDVASIAGALMPDTTTRRKGRSPAKRNDA